MEFFFLFPIIRHSHYAAEHSVFDLIVQTDFYIILNRKVAEKAYILEGSGYACLVDLNGIHTVRVFSVKQNRAVSGLINLGQKIENGCFACAVGTDKTCYLCFADCQVKIVNGFKSAEFYAEMPCFKNGKLINISLGDYRIVGNRYHLAHFAFAPFPFSFESPSLALIMSP